MCMQFCHDFMFDDLIIDTDHLIIIVIAYHVDNRIAYVFER